MKFLALLSLATAAYSLSLNDKWHSFKLSHRRRYTSLSEERFRRTVFADNLQKIEEHNKLYQQGLVSFRLGMNRFGDLLNHEFRSLMNRFNASSSPNSVLHQAEADEELPESVDWRLRGAVTPVKDQGKCGSCYSFSATGALEAQHFKKTGQLISLSEQNLIDCTDSYGNDGCQGGLMDHAFQYIMDNGGIDTEDSYPYEGEENLCRFKPDQVGAKITNFVSLPYGDEEAIRHAVATVGPVSAGIDAGHHSFQFYDGGLYYEVNCSSSNIDHAVLIVGYGNEDGEDYWLVKNSWNTVWGEDGYVRLARNKGNHCGIANKASYPVI